MLLLLLSADYMQSEQVSPLGRLFTSSLPCWLTVNHRGVQAAQYSKQLADSYLLHLHGFQNECFPLSCLSSRSPLLLLDGWYTKAMPWMHSYRPSSPLRGVFVLGYQSSAVVANYSVDIYEAAPSMTLVLSPLQRSTDWFVCSNCSVYPLSLTTVWLYSRVFHWDKQ